MTKNNLIFLGACSLLAPSTLLSSEEILRCANNALNWATLLYNKQHGMEEVKPEATSIRYRVERLGVDGVWRESYNVGLSHVTFDTRRAADKAIQTSGSGKLTRYRVVSGPVKYRIERGRKDGTHWTSSMITELQGIFSTAQEAKDAISAYGTSSFLYRVVEVE